MSDAATTTSSGNVWGGADLFVYTMADCASLTVVWVSASCGGRSLENMRPCFIDGIGLIGFQKRMAALMAVLPPSFSQIR